MKIAKAANPDVKLISPGPAIPSGDWLSVGENLPRSISADISQKFLQELCKDTPGASPANAWKGCSSVPDYLAVHNYDTDFETWKNGVADVHTKLGLPLYVTEFACNVCSLPSSLRQEDNGLVGFRQETTGFSGTSQSVHGSDHRLDGSAALYPVRDSISKHEFRLITFKEILLVRYSAQRWRLT